MLSVRLLHSSRGLAVSEVSCAGAAAGLGPEESSPWLDLVLPRQGTFACHLEGEVAIADASRVLLLAPGRPYRVAHRAGCADRCTVVSLSSRVAGELAEGRPPGGVTAPLPNGMDVAARRLVCCLQRPDGDALRAEEAALSLAAGLLRIVPASRPAGGRDRGGLRRRRELAWAAQELLAVRHEERLSLADLAEELECSPFHLSRAFRAETGLSLHRYQRRLRIRSALERLDGGERDLARLAHDLGFCDHAHFANEFRAETGLPPSAWRAERLASRNLQA